jgi:hypothetical protein
MPCLSQDPIRVGYTAPDPSISAKEDKLGMSMEVMGLTHFVHDVYTTKNGFGNRMKLDGTI